MCLLRKNASIKKITCIPDRLFKSWITTITTVMFQIFCFPFISPFLVLKKTSFLLSVVRVVQEHTQLIFYLGETNIAQPTQGMSRSSALFYLFPQYLTNSYPPWEIHKNYCSLGQYATASSELHVCQKLCRVLFVFHPLLLITHLSAEQF